MPSSSNLRGGPPRGPAAPGPAATLAQRTFENGLRLVYEPMPWLKTLSMTLLLPFGSATDEDGHEGGANVLHSWMQRGADQLGSRELSSALDDLGVRRGGSAGRESSSLTASFLASELAGALPLIASMATSPRLDDEEFEGSRELALQELQSLADAPNERLVEALHERFFASPQRRSAIGKEEGLRRLTPESSRLDAKRRVGPAGAVLALAGGASWAEVEAVAEAAFGSWNGQVEPLPQAATAAAAVHHVEADSQQVQIGLALPAARPGSDEAYVFGAALAVLSGGSGSRLFTEVREKRGLVYTVAAVNRALRGFGYTLGYAGTTPERSQQTLEVFLAELSKLRDGVTAAELERAMTGILSGLVMQGESSGATAARLASDSFIIGSPRTLAEIRDRFEAVTLAQVNAYLADNPLPEPTIVTLGPKRAALEGVAA